MALYTSLSHLIQLSTIALIVLIVPTAYSQTTTTTPCTGSMLASFTPCMNLLTNSTAGGTSSPTTDCCNSLKSLMKSGLDCLCLLVTASVPFQLPINRTLAASLPRACNMAGVPIQCKASVAPIPAPGPAALGPTPYPGDSPSSSPRASAAPEPVSPASLAPEGDTTPALTPPSGDTTLALNPPSTTVGTGSPPTNSGSRTGLTPSAAGKPYLSLSPSLLLAAVGAIVFKYNY